MNLHQTRNAQSLRQICFDLIQREVKFGRNEWRLGKDATNHQLGVIVPLWCNCYCLFFTSTVCMYVCMYVCTYVCTYVRMYVCTYVRMYVCTYVRMYVCTYVRMYVCTYVRMYVCTYVCMYVCIYIYICCFVGWKYEASLTRLLKASMHGAPLTQNRRSQPAADFMKFTTMYPQ